MELFGCDAYTTYLPLGSNTSRCLGNEPALLPPEERSGNRASVICMHQTAEQSHLLLRRSGTREAVQRKVLNHSLDGSVRLERKSHPSASA